MENQRQSQGQTNRPVKKAKSSNLALGWIWLILGLAALMPVPCILLFALFSSHPDTMTVNEFNSGLLYVTILFLVLGLGAGIPGYLILRPIKCRLGSHRWQAWQYNVNFQSSIPAGCEQERFCNRCGKREERREVSHLWSEWTYEGNTCNHARVCTRCQAKETGPESHIWGEWNFPPNSCREQRICTRCQAKETKPETHIWKEQVEAISPGNYQRLCQRCGGKSEIIHIHEWEFIKSDLVGLKHDSWNDEDIDIYRDECRCVYCGEITNGDLVTLNLYAAFERRNLNLL